MKPLPSFDVTIRNKVPFLTNFLFYLLMAFSLVFALIYFILLPTKYAPDEIKFVYFILVVPSFLKTALWYSTIGFIIITPIYIRFRIYHKAALIFFPDRIQIEKKAEEIQIPIKKIIRIFLMDSPKYSDEKLVITIQYRKNKTTRVQLNHYLQGEEFIEELLKYEKLKFEYYNFIAPVAIEDED